MAGLFQMNFAVFGLSFNVIYKCCLYIMCFAVSGLCNLQSQFFSDVFCRLWTFNKDCRLWIFIIIYCSLWHNVFCRVWNFCHAFCKLWTFFQGILQVSLQNFWFCCVPACFCTRFITCLQARCCGLMRSSTCQYRLIRKWLFSSQNKI